MAIKQPAPIPAAESYLVHLRINGMREVAPGEFEIQDVQTFPIDGNAIEQAVDPRIEDRAELLDKIGELIWRHQIVRVIAGRVER